MVRFMIMLPNCEALASTKATSSVRNRMDRTSK
jgi:hypothetical protein